MVYCVDMEKEKPLTENQKKLQSLAGRLAVKDWGEHLGDERLRMSRVMVSKLIRTGNEDVLDIVAEYLGTRLTREDA